MLYWYKRTNTDRSALYAASCALQPVCAVCWLYWLYVYKSTNTDAVRAMLLAVLSNLAPHASAVHPYAAQRLVYLYQILCKRCLALARCEVYSLYWYKSTNTDRPLNQQTSRPPLARATLELSLLALLVQKYKY